MMRSVCQLFQLIVAVWAGIVQKPAKVDDMAKKAKPPDSSPEAAEKVSVVISGEPRRYMLAEAGRRRAAGRRDWSMKSVISDALSIAFGPKGRLKPDSGPADR